MLGMNSIQTMGTLVCLFLVTGFVAVCFIYARHGGYQKNKSHDPQ